MSEADLELNSSGGSLLGRQRSVSQEVDEADQGTPGSSASGC